MPEDNRRQITVRMPLDVWAGVRRYYRLRREELEEPALDIARLHIHDVVIEIIKEGLRHLDPMHGVVVAPDPLPPPPVRTMPVGPPPVPPVPGVVLEPDEE